MKHTKVLSISHADLDGVSCQILLSRRYTSLITLTCSYNDTLETLKMVKKDIHLYDKIFITDLVVNEEINEYYTQLLETYPNIDFVWIDHHYQSLPFMSTSIIVDVNFSSTKLLCSYLGMRSGDFINAVNAFDMWDVDDKLFEDGLIYNTLFWEYKLKSFRAQFKRDQTILPIHRKDYERICNNRDIYFQDLENKKLILDDSNIVVIFGDLYQNWTQLLYPRDFNIQVFSNGKILIKINKKFSENQCISITNEIMENINNDLLLNVGGHYHILSLTHSGNLNYNIIIDYTKKIYNTIKTMIKE